MRESVAVEPKPPSFLANGLWFWRSIRWGGRRERVLASIAFVLLLAFLFSESGVFSSARSVPITSLLHVDPAAQRTAIVSRIRTAQTSIKQAHSTVSRDKAGISAFEELSQQVAELEALAKPGEIRDSKYVPFTDAEKQERIRQANLHLYSLRPAYSALRPILERAESACRDMENLTEESAQKFELLGAHHTLLGVLHRDLWTVSRGVQNVRDASTHTDETRMPHVVGDWIRETPAALNRLDIELGQLVATLEQEIAQSEADKGTNVTLKSGTTKP